MQVAYLKTDGESILLTTEGKDFVDEIAQDTLEETDGQSDAGQDLEQIIERLAKLTPGWNLSAVRAAVEQYLSSAIA